MIDVGDGRRIGPERARDGERFGRGLSSRGVWRASIDMLPTRCVAALCLATLCLATLCLAALCLAAVLPATCTAQEWTRFHGPNGTGINETARVPTQLTTSNILWTAQLPGTGHSSPVLWGERVFLQSADPQTGTQMIHCLHALTGEMLWNREYPSATYHTHVRNNFASASPAVDDQRVYVTWGTPDMVTLAALNHQGQEVWQLELGPFTSMHGWGTSPMVHNGTVYLPDQQQSPDENTQPYTSSMVAVNAVNGNMIWRAPRKSSVASYSVPCIFRDDQGREQLICCSTAHGIYSLNPLNGTENWSIDVFTMRTVSSPLLVDEMIFGSTGSGGGGNYVVALRTQPSIEVAYRVETQAPYVPTSVANGSRVFLWYDQGIVTCIDARSGDVAWRKRIGGNYSGSPIRVGQAIYCLADEGELVVIAAGDQFEELSRLDLGELARSTPAAALDRLFVRTETKLFCLGRP